MPGEYLTPAMKNRAVEVLSCSLDRGPHRALRPSPLGSRGCSSRTPLVVGPAAHPAHGGRGQNSVDGEDLNCKTFCLTVKHG